MSSMGAISILSRVSVRLKTCSDIVELQETRDMHVVDGTRLTASSTFPIELRDWVCLQLFSRPSFFRKNIFRNESDKRRGDGVGLAFSVRRPPPRPPPTTRAAAAKEEWYAPLEVGECAPMQRRRTSLLLQGRTSREREGRAGELQCVVGPGLRTGERGGTVSGVGGLIGG